MFLLFFLPNEVDDQLRSTFFFFCDESTPTKSNSLNFIDLIFSSDSFSLDKIYINKYKPNSRFFFPLFYYENLSFGNKTFSEDRKLR